MQLIKNKRALSPVIAAIILIVVTVAVSIAVAFWLGALTFGFMDTNDVEDAMILIVPVPKFALEGLLYYEYVVERTQPILFEDDVIQQCEITTLDPSNIIAFTITLDITDVLTGTRLKLTVKYYESLQGCFYEPLDEKEYIIIVDRMIVSP